MDRPAVISVGSVNVDFQVRTDRWPGPSETLMARDFLMISGGKAANVAYLARRLGAEARLIAHVGNDLLADRALEPLQRVGVDLRAVRRVSSQPTGAALIDVRADGEKAIILAANANDAWGGEDEEEIDSQIAAAPSGSVLAIDLEVPLGIVRRAMSAARRQGMPVVLDPSPASRLETGLYGLADYLTPDNGEAERLTGIPVHSPEDGFLAGEQLIKRGARAALVKLGSEGCAFSAADGARVHVRPVPATTVDATGAGDAFTGALAVALMERRTPRDAVCFAVAAAAIAVTRYGSQPSYRSCGIGARGREGDSFTSKFRLMQSCRFLHVERISVDVVCARAAEAF